jgi:hypothetical protein
MTISGCEAVMMRRQGWQERLGLLDFPALSVDELSGWPHKFEILHCGWKSRLRIRAQGILTAMLLPVFVCDV